ncbi:MAG: hypothetical protein L6Q92_03525 [Phycisphaerae bacterium]|nr:hypothetical protein [Phycisphaerae bacterium]
MTYWSAFFAILGIGFAVESMGLFAHELNAALSAMALVLSALFYRSSVPTRNGRDRSERLFGWAACALGLLLLPGPVALRLLAISLWYGGIERLVDADRERPAFARSLSAACLITGLIHFATRTSLISWYGLRGASATVSSIGSALSGSAMHLGPTYNGLTMLVLALCIGAFASRRETSRRWAALAAYLVVVALAYGSYLSLYNLLPLAGPDGSAATQPDGGSLIARGIARISDWTLRSLRFIQPAHVPFLWPALLAFIAAAYLRRASHVSPRPDKSTRRILVAIPVAALLTAWALTNVPTRAATGPRRVAFYKEGFLNWMTPNHQMYGSRSAGMFGNLPILCERMGWQAEIIPAISRDVLSDRDILCIMNTKDPLPLDALRSIYEFVERGGSLLMLGDHTFHKHEGRLLINDPIETTHIRFAFDSAYYFIGGWLHSYQYWPHQMTDALGDEQNDCGCVVGASLELRYPASPIVIGTHGFSDPGEDAARDRGFMGNSLFDRGEPLGDLVLVAAENVGNGRVVVVGDTSGFVNAIQTQTWPFTQRVFYWLASRGSAALPMWRDLLGLALLLTLVVLSVLASARHRFTVVLASGAMYAFGWTSHAAIAKLAVPPPLQNRIALVDLSHVGLHSVEGWRDNGISGVYLNFMREGWFSLGLPEFDEAQIMKADVFLTIAPTRPYSAREIDVLRRFMQAGGTLIISAGYEQRAGAQSLLDLAEMRLEHRPLGRAATYVPNATVTPQLWNAWPIIGGEPLVTLRNEPVIAQRRVGLGRIVWVADSFFFMNRNLETEDGGIVPNIQFFGWLMKQVVPGGEP